MPALHKGINSWWWYKCSHLPVAEEFICLREKSGILFPNLIWFPVIFKISILIPTEKCNSPCQSKKLLFAGDGDNYIDIEVVEIQRINDYGMPSPNASPKPEAKWKSWKREWKHCTIQWLRMAVERSCPLDTTRKYTYELSTTFLPDQDYHANTSWHAKADSRNSTRSHLLHLITSHMYGHVTIIIKVKVVNLERREEEEERKGREWWIYNISVWNSQKYY